MDKIVTKSVYAIIFEDKTAYIGVSVNPMNRLRTHTKGFIKYNDMLHPSWYSAVGKKKYICLILEEYTGTLDEISSVEVDWMTDFQYLGFALYNTVRTPCRYDPIEETGPTLGERTKEIVERMMAKYN